MKNDDIEIIEKVLKGDTASYEHIVKKYQQYVLTCAWIILQNHTDAVDIAQEVFIRFFKYIKHFDTKRELKPYLLTMTLNLAKSYAVKRSRYHKRIARFSDYHNCVRDSFSEKENPLNKILESEKLDRVRRLINQLPKTMKEVCCLFYLSECSCKEISQILKIGENCVKVNLCRARKKLIESRQL